ncbi:AAA family ATPase [Francisella tularensis]|uniref:AAA family ATPase n=1 Tax=Francisella tularensis TaxID=263 RepID=UPI0008F4997E|nr:AAA family ATPase [Francisella tularensis]APA83282.1 putative RecF protein [Francisella tularensis subsp. novicida PA10-7858]
MLKTLAINHYRSLFDLVIPLKKLNIITGVNASGKSNLYKALRLLAETAEGGVIHSLAKEGGLNTTFWAGPEKISRQMIKGEVAIQGNSKQNVARLRLGFADDLFGYSISLGYPEPSLSAFSLDPEIKRETIWAGDVYKASSVLVDRTGPLVKVRDGRKWEVIEQYTPVFESIFTQAVYIDKTPEIIRLREKVKGWRFYDHFRSDKDAPARLPQLGTRTPVLSQDGHDLAAALQTIIEIGDSQALVETIEDAFPGTKLGIKMYENGHFIVELYQQGLLRPLSASELSDGTLRYLLWVAALLTPRPPELMVLNEPETSLHPDLLPALARLIIKAAKKTQIWVVSHANGLVSALRESEESNLIELDKEFGQTKVLGQGLLDKPNWHWPDIK